MASTPSAEQMDCLDEDELLALVSGSASAPARRRLAQHVDGCEACRALAAALAHDDDVRRERPAPDASPEAGPTSTSEGTAAFDGRFRLLGTLGRGAMGVVYRAHDSKLGIDVALKVLREDAASAGGARAFARELAVGRRVTHPNVCRLYDAGEVEDAPYITMELLEGETLADVLAQSRQEKLSEPRARELLAGIAAGLAAVHAQGIVHRDLKPANVMVERTTGRPVLTDFGFATELHGEHSRRLVGTPAFWAPEQARGEAPTPASDVFSFGLLAYRLLANRDFSLSDPAALSMLPPGWRGFVGRCLEPRPGDRFPDAGAICAALERRSRPRRALLVVGTAAAAASVALAAAAFGLGHAPDAAPARPEPVASTATAPSTRIEMAGASAPSPPLAASEVAPPPPAFTRATTPTVEKRPTAATGRPPGHPASGTPAASARTAAPSAAPSTAPAPPAPRNDDPLIRH